MDPYKKERHSEPQILSKLLSSFLQNQLMSEDQKFHIYIKNQWLRISKPAGLPAILYPAGYQNGCLSLQAETACALQDLSFFKETLKIYINQYLDKNSPLEFKKNRIKKIHFTLNKEPFSGSKKGF